MAGQGGDKSVDKSRGDQDLEQNTITNKGDKKKDPLLVNRD